MLHRTRGKQQRSISARLPAWLPGCLLWSFIHSCCTCSCFPQRAPSRPFTDVKRSGHTRHCCGQTRQTHRESHVQPAAAQGWWRHPQHPPLVPAVRSCACRRLPGLSPWPAASCASPLSSGSSPHCSNTSCCSSAGGSMWCVSPGPTAPAPASASAASHRPPCRPSPACPEAAAPGAAGHAVEEQQLPSVPARQLPRRRAQLAPRLALHAHPAGHQP